MTNLQGYNLGSPVEKILNVTVTQSGNKTYLDVNPSSFSVNVNPVESTDFEAGGNINVGSPGIEITFTGVTQSVLLTSINLNDNDIYIGKSGVSSDGTNHFTILYPGDDIVLNYNDSSNSFWAVSKSGTQVLSKGALL